MNITKLIYTLFFACSMLTGWAQLMPDTVTVGDREGLGPERADIYLSKKKPVFSVEFGTTFATSGYGSFAGTYVSPRVSYPVSKKWTLGAGARLYGMTPLSGHESAVQQPYPYYGFYPRSFLYLEGAYMMNENLRLTGLVYKEINPFGQGNVFPGYQSDIHGVIMGVDYRIGEHVLIRGEVEFSNGRSPYRYGPMNGNTGGFFSDPFYFGR